MANEVLFLRGTQAAYEAIETKSNYIFYFCTDTNQLYIGSQLLTNSGELAAALSRIAVNENDITSLQGDVNTLNGDAQTAGSVRNIVATEVARIIANADTDFDTLKEIADWIIDHASDAAQMNSDIQDLKSIVGEIPQGATSTDIVSYISEVVANSAYDPTDVTNAGKCIVIPGSIYKNSNINSADFPIALAIQKDAFNGSLSLSTVNIPLVKTIEEGAFASCINLSAINIPSVSYVGKDSFAMCMNAYTLNAPLLEVVGNGAFQNTHIEHINLPNVNIIEDVGFGGSFDALDISIPVVTKIGSAAFQNAEKVESLVLTNIRSIGSLAFYDCKKLSSVTIDTDWVPTADHDIFMNTPMDTQDAISGEIEGKIYVRGNLLNKFKTASGWSTYANCFDVIPGTEVISELPSVSASDAGKVLAVDQSGSWTPSEQNITWGSF